MLESSSSNRISYQPVRRWLSFIIFARNMQKQTTALLNRCGESPQLPLPHLAHHGHQASRQIAAPAMGLRLGLWQRTSPQGRACNLSSGPPGRISLLLFDGLKLNSDFITWLMLHLVINISHFNMNIYNVVLSVTMPVLSEKQNEHNSESSIINKLSGPRQIIWDVCDNT